MSIASAPAAASSPVSAAESGNGRAGRAQQVNLNGRRFVLSDGRRGRNAAQARNAATQSPVQRNVQSAFYPVTSAAGSLARIGNRVLVKAVQHKSGRAADTARSHRINRDQPRQQPVQQKQITMSPHLGLLAQAQLKEKQVKALRQMLNALPAEAQGKFRMVIEAQIGSLMMEAAALRMQAVREMAHSRA